MVFYRERDNERPPLSLILPHLYLGAETDVTQDCLAARGISYVLSVSRCSPQPAFLPGSRYLRVPIDDSLRDDLLPWIPEALRFIDEAMSAGGSVLVHCAAGISRSPALAVAYIMYSLGMDLDHAYRFVKERRPSISPNFNFLGQLQHFQGTLAQKATSGNSLVQTVKSLDACLQPTNENIRRSSTVAVLANQSANCQDNAKDFPAVGKIYSENPGRNPEQRSRELAAASEQRSASQLTLSLSSKLRTLTLTLNQQQKDVRALSEVPPLDANEPERPMTPKPVQPQIPSSFASLTEKRKSLTLSLSPVSVVPPTRCNVDGAGRPAAPPVCASNAANKRKAAASVGAKRRGRKASDANSARSDDKLREATASHAKAARPDHGSSQNTARGEREGQTAAKSKTVCPPSAEKGKPNTTPKPRKDRDQGRAESRRGTVVAQQAPPETPPTPSAVEAREGADTDQGLLSPLNLTVNKLLGWGERMLLGVLLGPRIKVGQAALPYRC